MKPKSILRLLFIASLIFPAACGVKDPIYNTPHPGHGTVTLTTEWDGIGSGLTAPGTYTATATPDGSAATAYTATLSGVTNRLGHLFAPGTYRFLVHNTPEHITVSATTATVAQAPAPPAATSTAATPPAGPFIQSAPGWLFTSALDATLSADAEHTLTAPMQQQVRELTLIITPTGGTTDRIAHIGGYLSGAASTLDLATATHAAPQNVALAFTKITTGAHAGSWSATVRLLGTAGPRQQLAATITFTGNTPAPVPLYSDLTPQLAPFNTGKHTPLTLDGTVVETPTPTGFTATITDWETVTGGPIVAE